MFQDGTISSYKLLKMTMSIWKVRNLGKYFNGSAQAVKLINKVSNVQDYSATSK